jgi:hypothetical protein
MDQRLRGSVMLFCLCRECRRSFGDGVSITDEIEEIKMVLIGQTQVSYIWPMGNRDLLTGAALVGIAAGIA